MLDSIDLIEAGLLGELEPVASLVRLAHLCCLLNLLDKIVNIRHLLLLVVPLGQTEVLVHHDNVAWLLVLKE